MRAVSAGVSFTLLGLGAAIAAVGVVSAARFAATRAGGIAVVLGAVLVVVAVTGMREG
jgi:hypothetical protein